MKKEAEKRIAASNLPMDPERKFLVSESYKTARTNLMFSLTKKGCKKIVFTSSLSGEGKSTSAVNIAISLAEQVEGKVLLVDSDLRKPIVNRYFGLEPAPGLSNFLRGMCKAEEIVRPSGRPNLFVLCSGVPVPNPSELLAGEAMGNLFAALEPEYEYILLDTSPINVVVDALPLAKLADGVVIVVQEGFSTYPELTKTVHTLRRVGAGIIGILLNGAVAETGEGYRYRYEYGA